MAKRLSLLLRTATMFNLRLVGAHCALSSSVSADVDSDALARGSRTTERADVRSCGRVCSHERSYAAAT
jgi:hypothetical protein